MLETIILLLTVLISYVLQNSINFFSLLGLKPDFLLLFVIYVSIARGSFLGVWLGVLCGFLQDINLGNLLHNDQGKETVTFFIGTHTLPKAIIGYSVSKVMHWVNYNQLFLTIMLVFVFSLVEGLLTSITLSVFHPGLSIQFFIRQLVPVSIYNAILSIFWLKLLAWLIPLNSDDIS